MLEIADRVNMHLAKMQKEHPMLKLDQAEMQEIEANKSVLQLIKLERAAEEEDENAIVLG